MQTYLKGIAGALNASLLVLALVMVMDPNPIGGKELLFAILLIITPAFTLFTLFAPHGH